MRATWGGEGGTCKRRLDEDGEGEEDERSDGDGDVRRREMRTCGAKGSFSSVMRTTAVPLAEKNRQTHTQAQCKHVHACKWSCAHWFIAGRMRVKSCTHTGSQAGSHRKQNRQVPKWRQIKGWVGNFKKVVQVQKISDSLETNISNRFRNLWIKTIIQKSKKVCEVDSWWIHPEPADCFYKCDSVILKWNITWSRCCCWTWGSQSVFIRTVCSAIITAAVPETSCDTQPFITADTQRNTHNKWFTLLNVTLLLNPPPFTLSSLAAVFSHKRPVGLCERLKHVSKSLRHGSSDGNVGLFLYRLIHHFGQVIQVYPIKHLLDGWNPTDH